VFPNAAGRDDDRAVLVRFGLGRSGARHGGGADGDAEMLGADLFALGATGIEERADDDGVVLLAGFPNRPAAQAALQQLPERWRTVAVVDVPDDTWFDGWRAWARPQRAGRHLVVHPPWVPLDVDPPVGAGDLVIAVDPGRSFGSGAHPTTRLVLAVLEDLVLAGSRVLDLGCGSGVLGIAAARLGAGEVLAVDIDPAAVTATRANQARNGVSFAVTDSLGTPPEHPPFDLAVANIGANTLVELAPALLGWARTAVLSGYFSNRAGEVAAAYTALGATVVAVTTDVDGWTATTVRR